jgi:S-DNA-T family DNA segregation ATPase FtsK/SpoIIIE
MNIKKIASNTLQFIINRLIEIIGVCISLIGALLLIALVSYSPSDPNFIFPENTEIQNILGFQGSYISDLFFQSIGAISYLISITLFVTGINIFNRKDLFLIIENIFFSIFYCIFGSLFFDFFHKIHSNYILMEMVDLLDNTLAKPFLKIF